jgi:hypothetical protein
VHGKGHGKESKPATRQAFQGEVTVQVDGEAAMLVNLSITGAQVLAATALKPNRMVTLVLPRGKTSISCKGKIVWARLEPHSTGTFLYRAGVSFTKSDEAAVEAFIAHTAGQAR